MSERFESGCLETPMVLDHSLVRMNLQLRSQSHVAHQSRREKLRAQHNPFSPETVGNQNDTSAFSDFPLHETSPSITNKAEQARQANETSSSATGYPAHPTNTEMGDEMQAYDAHIMTSEMQNFPSGIELLGFSSKNSFLQQTSGGDVSASRPSMIGTSYQSPENPNSTVGNWKSLSGLQSRSNSAWASSTVAPNSIQGLDHNGGYGGQNLSNPLVVAGGGLHIRLSRDELKGDIEAHASHAQAGAMQLYLANPKYPSGYPETPTSANMIVTHPTNGIDAQGLETHEKHLVEVPLHFSTFSHNALPLVSDVNTSTQTARESNQIQWQSGGIGLPGSGNNMQHHNQFVFPQLINNTMSWNNRAGGSQSIHVPWSRGPFVEPKGVDALVRSHDCMSTGPDRSGQGLSLSLSSHQSSEMHLQDIGNHANVLQMGGEVKAKSGDLLNGTQGNTDGFGYFPSYSRDGSPGKGILNSFQAGRPTMNMNGLSPMFAANNASDLKNSRYLKAAQELLYEFCNVDRGNRPNNAKQKISKTQEWDGRPSMGYNVVHCGSSTRSEVAGNFESGSMDLPLYSGDRFELQRRKAKLVSMLEEVGRRYKYYCDQMHLVVTSFESVTCVGAAAPYTALALEAMSKHFRCLKDAIIGQLQVTSKVLGEKNSIVPGTTRGETPRLGFLDRTIRQQRAFQQLGMMEQHPWRPQRGLPERSVSVLRAWLFEHFLHPYPTDADKHILAKQTGLSRSQVSNWFINARVRLWKPMVEEMYVEETKEDKMEVTPPKGEQNEEQENFERVTGTSSHEKNVYEHGGPDHNQTASEEVTFKLDHSCSTSQTAQESSGGKTLHLQSQQKIDDMKEVEMNLIHESESLTSMNTSEADMRLEEAPGYKNNFDEEKRFRNDQFFLNKLQAIDHTDTTLDFSSYNNNASTVTYSHEDLTPRQFASNGVSLTLGLRHSGGLPFPMVEQKYSNTLYFTREQEDDDPNNRYNMLANQENQGNGFILDQNLPYRNYANGSRLLHDFVG